MVLRPLHSMLVVIGQVETTIVSKITVARGWFDTPVPNNVFRILQGIGVEHVQPNSYPWVKTQCIENYSSAGALGFVPV